MSTTYYGALSDTFSIDSDGGASYFIPIEAPPGTAKMQPNIQSATTAAAGMDYWGWAGSFWVFGQSPA